MPRSLGFFATSAIDMVFCLTGQDSPSLGELARQAQKDKSNAPAKKVFTNEDLPSGLSSGPLGTVAGVGGDPATGKPGTSSPAEQLNHLESLLNQLDSIDRATLAKNVLRGNDVPFAGRSKWEEKLFEAKQAFVTQGRELIKRAQEINASAKSVQDVHDPNDPRVKDLSNRLQQLIQDGVRIGGTFQGVIEEGKDLASQSSPR